MKLADLAKAVNGIVIGNEDTFVKNLAPIEDATPGCLVFVLEKKLLDQALKSKASAILARSKSPVKGKPAILVDNPRKAMAQILALFASKNPPLFQNHLKLALAQPLAPMWCWGKTLKWAKIVLSIQM